ncbi:hypothetical protein [Serratia sp. YC16]|uniref:hypothetical protein n=1 Tax=Serratia sp. YC16 TaxID=2675312 RepID=UPI0018AB8B5F|nr:hypothetical protein [Serratia sp. YC16]
MKSKIVRYLVSVFFLLLAGNTYSATVEGSFSDWYWLNNQPAINYNFTSVVVTGVEDGAWWAWTPKRIVCAWQCNLMVYANFGWGPGDCFAAPKSWGGD